jgi:hypothetical protein
VPRRSTLALGVSLLNAALIPFMLLAAMGFLLSVSAHILSLLGIQVPGGNAVMGLHIGIFAVWLPAVLVSRPVAKFGNRWGSLKILLGGCPRWMIYGVMALFIYAIVNFLVFMGNAPNQSHLDAGWPPSVVRGFSGHWMLFYAAAFSILYSRIHAPQLFAPRKCPAGHTSSPSARFCPECGFAFQERPRNT